MPIIDLEDLDPRDALATIIGSIALEEAAISHVLNAEGEKIQAAVGITGATLGDLQSINTSVGKMVDTVASLEELLQSKLRTAMQSLYPTLQPVTATVTFRLTDDSDNPIQSSGATFIWTAIDPTPALAVQPTPIYIGTAVRFYNVPQGAYTVQQEDAPTGYSIDNDPHIIDISVGGTVEYDGNTATLVIVNPVNV
jgi:hypothetical protein